MNLASNRLNGDIPTSIYNPQFTKLLLGQNLLEGSIKSAVGLMTNLIDLELGPSNMTNGIPPELYTLTKLQTLSLPDSSFTGPLSLEGFTQLSNLRYLSLQRNAFTGPIPTAAIENMKDLMELRLFGNSLTGTISNQICADRGTDLLEISILLVDCNIECLGYNGCCIPCGDSR